MKNPLSLLSRSRSLALTLSLAVTPLLFTACDEEPYYEEAPPYQGGGGYYQPGPPPMTQSQRMYFERGHDAGKRDKALLRTNHYKRYSDDYSKAGEEFFRAGYAEGYGTAMGPTSDMNPTQRGVYMTGYDAGRSDYASARSNNFKRHRGNYPNVVEPYFALGYDDGFRGLRPR